MVVVFGIGMFEKRFAAVAPQLLTSDGTVAGQITVADASLYKVKQTISLQGTSLGPDQFQVQRVPNINTILLGPVGSSNILLDRSDVSAYTVAAGAFIFSIEQQRTGIPEEQIERWTYEEEPTVARRVVIVDKMGNKIDSVVGPDGKLRLGVDTSVSIPTLDIELDAFSKNPPDNVIAVGTEDGTKTVIKHALKIDSNGDAHVINMGALVPKEFDDIEITYSIIAGQKVATTVQYFVGGLAGTLVATLTLTYDGAADLINVART